MAHDAGKSGKASATLEVHPAFYRRLRHYRQRIALQVAARLANAVGDLILGLLENPGRGQQAGFEAPELARILRASVPGFPVFAVFYRWDGSTLRVITLEHTAQDLPSRLANIVAGQ